MPINNYTFVSVETFQNVFPASTRADESPLPSAEESFSLGWQQMLRGETFPVSELWVDEDA